MHFCNKIMKTRNFQSTLNNIIKVFYKYINTTLMDQTFKNLLMFSNI